MNEDNVPASVKVTQRTHDFHYLDLVMAVFAAMDKEANIEYIDMPEAIRERLSHLNAACLYSIDRLLRR